MAGIQGHGPGDHQREKERGKKKQRTEEQWRLRMRNYCDRIESEVCDVKEAQRRKCSNNEYK